jgi:enoyl-CoA hydratase
MGDELPWLSNDGRIAMEKREHILLIVIDRPKKLNGFDVKMLLELGQAFSATEDDSDIRCGVLCAEGRNFTAGLELNQVAKHLAEGPLFPEDSVDPVNLHGRLRTKPLVAAVQGICFTLGIELMLASDIVVAASDCRFAQIEVKRGIMPSAGATIRMTEQAGLGNALRYLLTGEEFNAETISPRSGVVSRSQPWGRGCRKFLPRHRDEFHAGEAERDGGVSAVRLFP